MKTSRYYTSTSDRALVLPGMPADSTYTFRVQAYRRVDKDINASGVIVSDPATTDPYKPEAQPVFLGDLQGTIQGRGSVTVVENIEAIASDAILSTAEKPGVIVEYNNIVARYLAARDATTGAVVTEIKTARDKAKAAKDALDAYLASLTPAWNDTTVHTPIDPSIFQAAWAGMQTALSDFETSITANLYQSLQLTEDGRLVYQPLIGGTPIEIGNINPDYLSTKAATSATLTNESFQLWAFADGNISSYDGADGEFKVYAGNTQVGGYFTLSVIQNAKNLTVAINGMHYAVTAGFPNEANTAAITLRATGSGPYLGIDFDKVFSLSKVVGGYQIVDALPSDTDPANFKGRIVYVKDAGRLYTFNGTKWVGTVDAGSTITADQLDSSIAPIILVSELPTTKTSEYVTLDGKLYHWDDAGGKYSSAVPATDLEGPISIEHIPDGAVTAAKFASTIEPVTIVDGLPAEKVTSSVYNTADGKLYRWDGSKYTASVATADLSGVIDANQIKDGAVTVDKIAANAIASDKIAAGAISADKLSIGVSGNRLTGVGLGGNPNRFCAINWDPDGAHMTTNGTSGQIFLSPGYGTNFPSGWSLEDGSTFAVQQVGSDRSEYKVLDLALTKSTNTAGNYTKQWEVSVGERYEFSIYTGAHRCDVQIGIEWLDVNGGQLSGSGWDEDGSFNRAERAGGLHLSDYKRLYVRGTAPEGAYSAWLIIRKHATTSASDYDSWAFLAKPYFGVVGANVTALTPWSSPGSGSVINGDGIVTNSISAQQLQANSVVAGKIAAGAVTANEIAAGAITASKVSITGGNFCPDPNFTDDAYWQPIDGWYTESGGNAGSLGTSRCLSFNGTMPQGFYAQHTQNRAFPYAGKAVALTYKAMNPTGDNFVVTAEFRSADGNYVGGIGGYVYAGTGPADYSWQVIVPQGTATVNFCCYSQGVGPLNNQWFSMAAPFLTMAATGELIVDGAISAQKIAANAVTAEKIAAGSITTAKLTIAPKSLVVDPTFSSGSAGWANFYDRQAAGPGYGWPTSFASRFTGRDNLYVTPLQVQPGETYKFTVWAWCEPQNSVNGTGGVGFVYYFANSDGYVPTRAALGNTNAPGWNFLTAYLTIPSGIVSMQFGVWTDRGVPNGYVGDSYFGDFNIEKVNDASLIVDGAITAQKIAANAITADKIQAGAITGGKIQGNTVTADKLTVGSRGVYSQGFNFRYNPSSGQINWDSGVIFWVGDDGQRNLSYISGGAASWPNTYIHLYWNKGDTFLSQSIGDWSPGLGDNSVELCIWQGGGSLVVMQGATIIDGGNIYSNTITGDKIQAGSITADKIQAGSITAAQLSSGQLISNSAQIGNLVVDTINVKSGAVSGYASYTYSGSAGFGFIGGYPYQQVGGTGYTPSSTDSTILVLVSFSAFTGTQGSFNWKLSDNAQGDLNSAGSCVYSPYRGTNGENVVGISAYRPYNTSSRFIGLYFQVVSSATISVSNISFTVIELKK